MIHDLLYSKLLESHYLLSKLPHRLRSPERNVLFAYIHYCSLHYFYWKQIKINIFGWYKNSTYWLGSVRISIDLLKMVKILRLAIVWVVSSLKFNDDTLINWHFLSYFVILKCFLRTISVRSAYEAQAQEHKHFRNIKKITCSRLSNLEMCTFLIIICVRNFQSTMQFQKKFKITL